MTCVDETPEQDTATPEAEAILDAFLGLEGLAKAFDDLDDELAGIGASAQPAIAEAAQDLRRRLQDFEPNVTMIGQVKAGKTTLVNALAGWPDLLPADVNPWTSVVTSLHLRPNLRPGEHRSRFRFFSNEEWDRLITRGGRVGELANRAGAEDELEKVRQQLDEMRAKSKKRLGRKFEMLLGQTHDYEMLTESLIQRYVCLGDDFWEDDDESAEQGRYADITRSADLWLGRPHLPVGLCLQDTPGVNDTFMIREQITINALRGARLCVVVLSAQQALSSVDMGLIRLISTVKSRDIIIFVNRIDELTDPVREVPQIRRSIEDTLKKFDGPTDAEILFGSGFWAGHAVADTLHDVGEDSGEALLSWAEARMADYPAHLPPLELIWHLSGLPALGEAISERIERGAGASLIERVEAAKANLLRSAEARADLDEARDTGALAVTVSHAELAEQVRAIETRIGNTLASRVSTAHEAFLTRVNSAHLTFLDRATASLLRHLESQGQEEVWTYDPVGLRLLLRSAYQVFTRAVTVAGREALEEAAREISTLYRDALGLGGRAPEIQPPPLPAAEPPVALGQTIALDLRGNWWTRFWRKRRGYEALCDDFAALIHEETAPVVSALRTNHADTFAMAVRDELQAFVDAQRDILTGLLNDDSPDPPPGDGAAAPARALREPAGQTRSERHLEQAETPA